MSKNSLPCPYADYQGTRWHRRFVSGEFILQFDQGPGREVIIDHIAEQQPSDKENKKAWNDRIRAICTQESKSWNLLSPGELVEQLREERKLYYPEAKLHWRSSSFPSFSNKEANAEEHEKAVSKDCETVVPCELKVEAKREESLIGATESVLKERLVKGITEEELVVKELAEEESVVKESIVKKRVTSEIHAHGTEIQSEKNKSKGRQNPLVFVFPDVYDACPLDEQVAILVAQFRISGTGDLKLNNNTVFVCIPETHEIEVGSLQHYQVQGMSSPTDLGKDLMKDMASEGVILCSDVWYAYAFLKRGIAVHSFLDRREWFASVVLHDNIPDNTPTTIPGQSCYGELLHTGFDSDRALREYHYLTHIPSNGVEADLAQEEAFPQWVEQAMRKKRLSLTTGFYTKQQDATWKRTERASTNTVHVASAFFDKDEVMMEPVFFAGKHSPLSLSYPDGGFFTSFNYYFTENLKSWYANKDKRVIPWDDFMVDYLAFPQGEGLYESVPLYNKALLGYGKDGSLFACEGAWESITLTLDGNKTFVFKKDEAASESLKTDLPVHKTPRKLESSRQQKNTSEIYFPTEQGLVGEGRWCLTFIHDYLWDASEGPVQVPPIGVVVTTTEMIEHVEKVSWAVEWKDLPMDKGEVTWLAGGFNLLIKDRKNLVATQEETHAQLEKEGWFTPNSLMTQETALDVAGVQPRSVIGCAGDKILVMSVTGRNSKSQGISFSDAASLAVHITEEMQVSPLEFLLNLDGGASSVLGCKKDGEASLLLTKPSPSITNPAGCPRCVPSLLTIKLKPNSDEDGKIQRTIRKRK